MRILFRALAVFAMGGLVFNLALAQKSLKEIPESEHENLRKAGGRETHQGPDNPMQGNTSKRQGRWGGPDPYGPEGFEEFREKNERQLHDPQVQLQIDLHDPKRIVIDQPDGTSREYWYVLFRVINNTTRSIRQTQAPTLNEESGDPSSRPESKFTRTNVTQNLEGVPFTGHLDFELQVFQRDVEAEPWNPEWSEDPEEAMLSDEVKALRRANIKRTFRAISDPHVLRRIAEQEQMWEWAPNRAGMPEPVMLLHPLSDFQRQVGHSFDLENGAPDLSGPRCLSYRFVYTEGSERTESMRYVAIYGDNTYAGIYGEGDTLPDGATLVSSEEHPMWGKLTQRRYEAGDCVDRFGRPLGPNEPGYLNARIAGGSEGSSYGLLQTGHPAIGQPVKLPHVRLYKNGDTVLFGFNTGVSVPGSASDTYRINGKVVGEADPRFASGVKIDSGTEQFGSTVVGRPVKMLDSRGRALRRSLVTYQAGDVLTQAEWDIWRSRLGPQILSRYTDLDSIVGRPLRHEDPVVNLPRIKLGYFIGDSERAQPETIQRGIDTGRKGPAGEPILELQEYVTGRHYNARTILPEDFRRDPEGEYTTNRIAPVPAGAQLNPGEEYIYAPLGSAGENAVPVPRFDRYGAWQDYMEELSGARVPLTDESGALVRDHMDQILYLKDYEYEYTYMHEFESTPQTEEGYKGQYGGGRWKLVTEPVRMMFKDGKAWAPLMRVVHRTVNVNEPIVVDGYSLDGKGVTAEEYRQATGSDPGPNVLRMKLIRNQSTPEKRIVGAYTDGMTLPEGSTAETWEQAAERATAEGYTVQSVEGIRFINRFREHFLAPGTNPASERLPIQESEFEQAPVQDNGFEGARQTWRRWTVPPPMVYRDPETGEWQVITRLADKIGPATRWDGADAPRFTTRYVSEMWGAAIFSGVTRDWDWANVMVRGLRSHVAKAGLTPDENVIDLPNPADLGATREEKAFFRARMTGEEWVYRVRYERLGDEFENFRDLMRKQRTFWYRESDRVIGSQD